jgi:hypothetical protein
VGGHGTISRQTCQFPFIFGSFAQFVHRTNYLCNATGTHNRLPSFLVAKNKDLCAGQHVSVLRILAPRDSYHVMRPFARGCFGPCAWCRLSSIFTRNFCFRRSTSAIPFGPCTTFGHQAYHVAAKRRSEGSSLRPGRREQPRARPGGAAVNRDDGCGVGRWERHAMHRCDRGRSAAEVAQISCDTPYGETMDRAFVSNRSTRSHTYSDSVASCGHFRASCGRFRSVLPRGRWRDRFNSPV